MLGAQHGHTVANGFSKDVSFSRRERSSSKSGRDQVKTSKLWGLESSEEHGAVAVFF